MMSTSDTATSTTTSHDPPAPDQTSTTTTREEEQQLKPVVKEYLDSFPVGYRFMPTDEELLHYLTLRYQKFFLPPNRFNEINLYDHHPEYLTSPGRFKAYENEEWYFFTPRDRKYRNGDRPKRSAGNGYWKATGVDKKILWDEVKKEKLGSKKTLVFYVGKPPKGIKTCWVMNEFKLDQTSIQKNSRADMLLDDSVLCRIHIKKTKSSDSTTSTSSGSRKQKSVHHDHSLSSLAEEDDDDHLLEEEEEDHLQEEEEALSVRGETDVYNDMEDEHLICSKYYDSIMQQYYPTNLNQILNNNSTTAYSKSNIMGAASSSSSSTAVRGGGAASIMPLQTCPPTWGVTAPVLNDHCYMDTSGTIVSPDMVSMSATHNTHSRQGYDDYIQQWGHRAPLADQQWLSSLSSSLVPGLPASHPPLSSLSGGLPPGHPTLPQMLQMPPQMSPQMSSQMQQHGYHHHQLYSSSWADDGNNNNIDGSSSGIHAIRRECRERHMVSKENDHNNSTTEHSEYFNAEENLESFDQTLFSTSTFNGSTTLPDCGWSRR